MFCCWKMPKCIDQTPIRVKLVQQGDSSPRSSLTKAEGSGMGFLILLQSEIVSKVNMLNIYS